jgi:hypothetical protein
MIVDRLTVRKVVLYGPLAEGNHNLRNCRNLALGVSVLINIQIHYAVTTHFTSITAAVLSYPLDWLWLSKL